MGKKEPPLLDKYRDVERESDVGSVAESVEIFRLENGDDADVDGGCWETAVAVERAKMLANTLLPLAEVLPEEAVMAVVVRLEGAAEVFSITPIGFSGNSEQNK